MHLQNFLQFPSIFVSRQDSWKPLRPRLEQREKVEKGKQKSIILKGRTGEYEQVIEVIDEKIRLASEVKISCTCPSFKFEFAFALNKSQALHMPENFIESTQQVPKKKNIYKIPTGCKHIIAFARFIDKHKHKYL